MDVAAAAATEKERASEQAEEKADKAMREIMRKIGVSIDFIYSLPTV